MTTSPLLLEIIGNTRAQADGYEAKAAALRADKPDLDANGAEVVRTATSRERKEALVEDERARQLRSWADFVQPSAPGAAWPG